jgi:hypothetical protein
MPFSLTSYLLGVGTVVGALAFSIGSGALVTKTVKETAAGATRAERVARAEPAPAAAAQQQGANDHSSPPAEPAPAARSDPASVAQETTQVARPQPDTRQATESARRPEPPTRQPQPKKQAEPANPTEQEATQKRTAERKVERQKHYAERAERRPGPVAASRTKQPPSEERDQPERTSRTKPPPSEDREGRDRPERTEFVFGREEPGFFGWEGRRERPHFDLFQMPGPPPFDRDD